ncbi:hypothetical protein BG015_002580 [Linnemannia schmuckeri]|uniref:GYF domain-containing protein n=1 Tax=Linnemannia schmuckeri TaxID=64567 RepID=A0A9P5S5L4_9FUNG|nr:hypothetical protein BG015_002580 [Linnemannia schmuckeri]
MATNNKRSTSEEWTTGSSGASKPKRVRLGGGRPNPEDLEVDDSDMLEQRKARRGAVTVVEYQDGEVSSDEEEDGRKKKLPVNDEEDEDDEASFLPAVEEGDDENDMFADVDPEKQARIAKEKESLEKKKQLLKKKKGKATGKGFDRSEIEGEELIEEDLDEDDYDEEGNLKIEAFNMNEELEEGNEIDENGNFVRKLDPERFHDSWLEGLSRNEIESARRAHERKEMKARMEEKEAAASAMTETDIYVEIVNILRPSESVVEALQRLGGGKKGGAKQVKKKSWQKSKTTTSTDMETDVAGTAETEDDLKRRQAIEKLTDLCDKMMALGHFDIYEETYEQVVRKLRRADIIEDDWEVGTPVLKPGERLAVLLDLENDPLLASAPTQWEYKWANPQEGQDADQVFGPFSGADMKSWDQQGFFSNGILVRMVGDSTFEPATNTTFE